MRHMRYVLTESQPFCWLNHQPISQIKPKQCRLRVNREKQRLKFAWCFESLFFIPFQIDDDDQHVIFMYFNHICSRGAAQSQVVHVPFFCSTSPYLYSNIQPYGYGSIPINTIFRGMNIHLPAILMFTRGTRF